MDDYSIKATITADSSGFKKGIDEAQRAVSSFSASFGKMQKGLDSGLKKCGVDLGQFYNQGASMFRKFGVDIDKVASLFGVSGPLLSGIATATVALNKLGQAMDGMTSSIAKGTGATGKNLESLEASARAVMSDSVGRSAKEVGTMIADLNTRFGVTGKELEKLTKEFDTFASVTDSGTKEAINSIADVMAKWSITLESAPALMNQLTYASQQSGLSVGELEGALKSGQVMFSSFGMSVTDSIAFLTQLKKSGVDSTSALSAMRVAFAKWSKEGKDAKEGFKEVADAIKNARTNTEALQIATEAFGGRAGAEMVKVLKNGTEASEEMARALEDVGSAMSDTDRASRTTRDAMDDLRSMLGATFGQMGQAVSGVFTDLVDSVKNVLAVIQPQIDAIGGVFRSLLTGISGVVASITEKMNLLMQKMDASSGMVRVLNGVRRAISEQFERMQAIIEGFYEGLVILIDSIKIVMLKAKLAVEELLAPASARIAKFMNKILTTINDAINKINEAIEKHPLAAKLFGFSDKIEKVTLLDENFIGDDIEKTKSAITSLAKEVQSVLDGTFGKAKKTIVETSDSSVPAIEDIAEASEETSEDVAEDAETTAVSVKKSYAGLAKTVGDAFKKLGSTLVSFFKGVLTTIKNVVTAIPSLVGKLASGFVSLMSFSIDDAEDALLEFEDKVLTFFLDTLPKIPQFLTQAVSGIVNVVNQLIGPALQSTLNYIGQWLTGGGLSTLAGIVAGVVQKVADFIVANKKTLVSSFTAVAKAFIGLIKDMAVTGLGLMGELADPIASALEELLPVLTGAIDTVIESIEKNAPSLVSALKKVVEKVISAVTSYVTILLTKAMSAIGSLVSSLLPKVTKAVLAYVPTMITDILVGLVDMVSGLVSELGNILPALVTAVIKMLKTLFNDAIPTLLKSVLNAVGSIVRGIAEALPDLIVVIVEMIPTLVHTVAYFIRETLPDLISALVDMIPEIVVAVVEAIAELLVNTPSIVLDLASAVIELAFKLLFKVLEIIPSWVATIINGIGDALRKNSWESVKSSFMETWTSISNSFVSGLTSAITKVQEAFEALAKIIKEIFDGIFGGISSAFTNVQSAVSSGASATGNFFSNVGNAIADGWSKFKGWLGFETGVNNAPRGLALVGEAGPELVDFRGGERVYNAGTTQSLLAGSGTSNSFNVTFNNLRDTSAYAMISELKQYNREMAINGIL